MGKKAQPNCVLLMLHVPGSHCFLRVAGVGLGLGDVGWKTSVLLVVGGLGTLIGFRKELKETISSLAQGCFWPATVNLRSCCSQSFEL